MYKFLRQGGLGGLLLALQAAAQPLAPEKAVAQLRQLSGNVLVSHAAGMTTGAELLRVADGTRIITTANSEVVVVFDKGCGVRMQENQRLDVDTGKPCAALVPANLAVAVPAAGHGFAGLLIPGLLAAGAAAAGLGGGAQPVPPVSPN
jgi:hypothetical protein